MTKITRFTAISSVTAITTLSIALSACHTQSTEPVVTKPQALRQSLASEAADSSLRKDNEQTLFQAPVNAATEGVRRQHVIAFQDSDSIEASTIAEKQVFQQETAPPQFSTDGEKYASFDNNQTILTRDQSVSTFSIDVDTGAYSNIRRFLQNGQLPPTDAVRVEEMLNYFNYHYDNNANAEQPFSVMTEMGPTPWNTGTRLLHIGLQGLSPPELEDQSANLVFLIDVSGSMNSPNKLGLLKSAISLMVQQMDQSDTVSIVVYAGSSGVVLEPTSGDKHREIERALGTLQAGGSTNGAQGIELAYQLAQDNFVADGTNRVILATDGDFNVGTSDTPSLVKMIEQKRDAGIALTTLGFGMGNYNDHLMEQLADSGNGNYAYIDTLGEARKVLVEELSSTLITIAKDVKIQIEFNPATVSEYRLIGYTNRILNNEDFNNDKVDAGEIGAGHTVTALYEIALHSQDGSRHTPLRYGNPVNPVNEDHGDELAELRLRYKQPDSDHSELIAQVINLDEGTDTIEASSNAFQFSASVAAFGQMLRADTRVDDFGYDQVRELAKNASKTDPFGYRSEYLRLLDLAQSLDNLKRASASSDIGSKG